MHGDTYDYSRVEYLSARGAVEIGCRRHGFFNQPPTTHLRAGCRRCADEELKGLYSDRYFALNPQEAGRPAIVYYLRFSAGTEVFYKVGITRTSVAKRFGMVAGSKIGVEIISLRTTTLRTAFQAEQTLLLEHAATCPYTPKLTGFPTARALRLGQSECFSRPLSRAEHLALVGLKG